MVWYYVDDSNQRTGPIPQDELQRLVAAGTVRNDTLVWCEGMSEWMPYSQVQGTTTSSPEGTLASGTAGTEACRDCGRTFGLQDLVNFGGTHICADCKPAFLQRMREGGHVAGDMNYAGFWIRFCAKSVDGILMGMVGFAIGALCGGVMMVVETNETAQIATTVIYYLVSFAVGLVYYVWFHGSKGATPGKMACGLRVVTPDGNPITYGQSFGRYFGDMLSSIILGLGYIMAGFDEQKRALHDRICNTRVIRKS